VLDPEDAADIDVLAQSDDPALLALAATGYEELGLLPKAIKIYEKLHKEQPRDPVFPAALSDLYERAGMRDRAAKARDAAVKLGFEFEKPKPVAK
jgi:tetratricopeptide (TPR) repeat protein